MKEIFGIDFGTTNSATIGLDYESIQQYGDEGGQPFPSIIAIHKMTGEVKSGRDVWKQREQLRSEYEIISSIKTHLGTEKTWNIGDRTWYPTDIVVEILKGLKAEVKRKNGGDLKSAIVSIPIGFNPVRRRELRNAAKRAGIQIKNFISEPTAAVYKHYSKVNKWQKITVFDWGGGTLDIAVVELSDGNVIELSTLGRRLGGDDIDQKVAEWVHQKIIQATNSNKSFAEMSNDARDKMVVEAESVKRELSKTDESSIQLGRYDDIDTPEIVIKENQFQALIATELDKSVEYLKETIQKARVSIDEIGCILMVGGSSKLCGLVERLEDEFECEIIEPDKDSDWHVAHGAALLNEKQGKYKLSQNVGLVLSDDTYYPLIKRGQSLNHKEQTIFFGLVEDSPSAQFVFVESENNVPTGFKTERKTIGYLNVPTYGFLFEPIKLTFHIDNNLLFSVTASSQNRATDSVAWEFEELRFSYTFPK